jgi:hypothetical protein
VSFAQLNIDQVDWMELLGTLLTTFELIDLRPGFRAADYRLLQADVLMVRPAGREAK